MLLRVTLLQGGSGGRVAVSNLKKNCYPFSSFLFINTPSHAKIFIYSTYLLLLQHPSLPSPIPPFNRSHLLSWKNKLKHTGIDGYRYYVLFYNTKFPLARHKKYLLEAPYRTNETSKLKIFAK